MSHLAALLALLVVPHTALKRSEPAKDSRLSAAPARVSLWFTAEPQLAFSRIRLRGPAGDIPLDTIVADTGHALHGRIPTRLQPGSYRVLWQTAGVDGHPLRGEFSFTVLGAATAVPISATDSATHAGALPSIDTASPSRVSEVVAAEYRTVRWFEFAALLTVLGAIGFRHGVLPPLAIRGVPTTAAADRARRLGRVALAVYAIAALARLYTESAALHAERALALDALMPTLTTTVWGFGWIAGIIGAALVFLGWSLPRRAAGVVGTPLALTGALGMLLGPALSGHAVASRYFVPSVTLDMLHVASAGLWIGGVLMVLFVGVPAMRELPDGNRDAAVRALVSSFHPLALFCAPLVVITGVGMSWIRLGSFAALRTPYGTTLLWKVGAFALVLAMGSYNALRARKRLGTPEGTRRFVTTGSLELTFAVLVLAATTILVVSPVPSEITP
jgi:copper transport protein